MHPGVKASLSLVDVARDGAALSESSACWLKFTDVDNDIILNIQCFNPKLSIPLRQVPFITRLSTALRMHNCLVEHNRKLSLTSNRWFENTQDCISFRSELKMEKKELEVKNR